MRSSPARRRLLTAPLLLFLALGAAPTGSTESPVLDVMKAELDRTFREAPPDATAPLYFLSYTLTDTRSEFVSVQDGVIADEDSARNRVADVSVRVGKHELDNTHEIRGEGDGDGFGGGAVAIPLEEDPGTIRQALWQATDAKIRAARERYARVLGSRAARADDGETVPDFSREEAVVRIDPLPALRWDREQARRRVRELSRRMERYSFITDSSVSLSASTTYTYLVNSEGTRLQHGRGQVRLSIGLEGIAEDGMPLSRRESFDAHDLSRLPDDAKVIATIDRLAHELEALRSAPYVEPYAGPAILRNRASGVFFHEIFGHRIEGHRQKRSNEGQTFAARVGEPILPGFLSVVDDPASAAWQGQDLNGHYAFDDEGVPARRVTLVENGVLKGFLQSRSPLPGFPRSNGHGRRQPGREVVARQGNLMVLSSKQVPYAELRRMLIAECRKQQKPFGLIFDDISGGFTTTTRSGPQAFKVLPLLVTRVYPDGRPDEIVRGVDIVGTPLASFSRIVATADDAAVFNGFCGAESGWVPVSATSPSILVSQIEIEKRAQGNSRPPLLAAPGDASEGGQGGPPVPTAAPLPGGDPTLAAMADEMARTRARLKTGEVGPPYFVAYTVQEDENLSLQAEMGALSRADHRRSRRLWPDVRVGDPSLDSSNAGGRGFGGVVSLPSEPEYRTTRRAIWLATDSAYKQAIETLARKRAALQDDPEEERPPDLLPASPHAATVDPPALDVDRGAWEERLRAASAELRRETRLEEGSAGLRAERRAQRFLNSEGSWHRAGTVLMEVALRASARAADGTRVSDTRRFFARRTADLPSREQLTAAARDLARAVSDLAEAKGAEAYSGPVLFTGEAAALVFDRLLTDGLSDPTPPAAAGGGRFGRGGARADSLAGQMDRRILPVGIDVVDDPTRAEVEGVPLFGGYTVDDDGVPAEMVTLVEDGVLKGVYMSRIGAKQAAASNGHGRRAAGERVTGQPANVIVTARDGAADLKERLIALCREERLPYGLIVERLAGTVAGGGGFARGRGGPGGPGGRRGRGGAFAPEERSDLPDAIGFRKVYVDGREEIVRGGRFAGVTARALRAVAAAGTDRNAVTRRLAGAGPAAVTVVAPSVLMRDVEVRAVDRGGAERPPLIPRPPLN